MATTKDEFEFNYKKEKKRGFSDEQIEIILKVAFFSLLVIGLIGIGIFFPIYITPYCIIVGIPIIIYVILKVIVEVDYSGVTSALSIILVILSIFAVSRIANMIFMYHNLRKGGKEFIQKIERSGNDSLLITSKDSNNKKKRFIIDNSEYIINPLSVNKEYFIKKDGKYFLYVNKQISNQIKDIKFEQQESIKQEEIKQTSSENEDQGMYLYFLIAFVFVLFILFGSIKL
ncbi:hypothetical protein [Sebaldella sp. S0638]|uniref:hypothetical protein n=1 Tax=Sebaldella sp. S0638 TaxID=2957809 RepID=UPI00209CBBDF|nr:hypothetical protein [Sebaldella sp. S0638]MCP1225758.1 hypothetical protein [Sebaldella sp. S0638]